MPSKAEPRGTTGTIYLIAIQVVSRGLTFVGNQALLRVALQRNSGGKAGTNSSQAAVNAAYLVVLLGFILGTLLSFLYLYPAGSNLLAIPGFKHSFWLYAAATVLELLSEPCFAVIQQNALFRDRARAETTAAITRCVAACSAAVCMSKYGMTMSVLPFAVGQLGYGLSLFTVYSWSAARVAASEHFSLLPKQLRDAHETALSLFLKPLLKVAGAFYVQSIFKWLLTQGDTLVLSYFADLQSQGIFALASNYGGLLSRLLFQPVEESSRTVFGRLLATKSPPSAQSTPAAGRSPEIVQRRHQALTYLSTILHGYTLLVVIPCSTLLPQIFPTLISTLLGPNSQWNSTQTSTLLSAYSYYIPFLALNGILDAFVTSVATEAELGWQSVMMISVTAIYLSLAALFMDSMALGAVGLVYANIVNMTLRITFSLWFIRGWTADNIPEPQPHPPTQPSSFRQFCNQSTPSPICLAISALTALALHAQEQVKVALAHNPVVADLCKVTIRRLNLDLFDLSYLFSAAAVLVSTMLLTESEFLLRTVEPVLPRRVKAVVEPYFTERARKEQEQ
ncbi:Oligosaccharide translocation protein rft1 [Exophiala xenobiotica]|uniref:Man(5)GlcNAc(2)-PP-dolichol translocation protein RFT1 n=1 Tax=Lithohypha guttulata TaxID=1690604 RepID=A0ABR0KGY4_9EURO|nr:Oligosaccharide translocation protein rft1 [Lithohypha guttulata]KAK5327857.1 Oligosaccharide translocation protein rft1 [Exophiala xenobiotica]